jgi:acyl carrier protein
MSSKMSAKSSDADLLQKKDVSHVVRRILVQQSIDKPVSANDDLREIGLTSLDMVDLVLSVESEFNVRIPEAAITPANFRSIATIDALINSLRN